MTLDLFPRPSLWGLFYASSILLGEKWATLENEGNKESELEGGGAKLTS